MATETEKSVEGGKASGERRAVLIVAFLLGAGFLCLFALALFGIPFLVVYAVGHWAWGWQFPPSSLVGQVVIYSVGCTHAMVVYRLLDLYSEATKKRRAAKGAVGGLRVMVTRSLHDTMLHRRQSQGGPPDA